MEKLINKAANSLVHAEVYELSEGFEVILRAPEGFVFSAAHARDNAVYFFCETIEEAIEELDELTREEFDQQ